MKSGPGRQTERSDGRTHDLPWIHRKHSMRGQTIAPLRSAAVRAAQAERAILPPTISLQPPDNHCEQRFPSSRANPFVSSHRQETDYESASFAKVSIGRNPARAKTSRHLRE